ncbi:MAG TPA: flagellar protein FlaG [bacterium]|nr:flagellar protein FlaG [bacterium]HQO33200.1 flagellar protein FlaG [bacterium]HQP99691.1 flagellar protein FlaG [bacterium]
MQIQAIQAVSSPVALLEEDTFVQKSGQAVSSGEYESLKSTRLRFGSSGRSIQTSSAFLVEDLEAPQTDIVSKRVRIQLHHMQRPIVSVIDSKTNEVIREVPPEQLVNMLENLHSFLGRVLDQEA